MKNLTRGEWVECQTQSPSEHFSSEIAMLYCDRSVYRLLVSTRRKLHLHLQPEQPMAIWRVSATSGENVSLHHRDPIYRLTCEVSMQQFILKGCHLNCPQKEMRLKQNSFKTALKLCGPANVRPVEEAKYPLIAAYSSGGDLHETSYLFPTTLDHHTAIRFCFKSRVLFLLPFQHCFSSLDLYYQGRENNKK